MRSSFRQVSIGDLDDHCLLRIFNFLNPLPDLFNVARTSRRFSDLMAYGKKHLLVSTTAVTSEGERARSLPWRCIYPSLQEAIAASRPGDTIVLEQGEEHAVSECVVPWPLHLKGRGRRPEDTVLVACRGCSALLFMASGKMANLTVKARRAACVVHQRGRLLVDACLLDCNAEGLDHLFAPLVTLAHSRSAVPAGGPPPPACLEPACLAPAAPLPPPPPAQAPQVDALLGSPRDDAQAGALIVLGSKIKGGRGSVAVHTLGSGRLQNVRVINMSQECLFWFEVDSAAQGAAAAGPVTDVSTCDASLLATSGALPHVTSLDGGPSHGHAAGAPDASPSPHGSGQGLPPPQQRSEHVGATWGPSWSGAGAGPASGEACASNVVLRSKLWRRTACTSPRLPATPPASELGALAARLHKRPKPGP